MGLDISAFRSLAAQTPDRLAPPGFCVLRPESAIPPARHIRAARAGVWNRRAMSNRRASSAAGRDLVAQVGDEDILEAGGAEAEDSVGEGGERGVGLGEELDGERGVGARGLV